MSSSRPLAKTKTNSISSSKSKKKEEAKSPSQQECDQVYTAIKRWKAHDGAVLVPVVRKSTMAPLKEKTKPKWWKMKKSAKSTLCITTPDNLQREITATANDGEVQELFLLISRQVDLPDLRFDVPDTITNLYIIRCGDHLSASPTDQDENDQPLLTSTTKLILNGASTFCNIRLDEWQTKHAESHNLILGPGVVIQLSMGMPWTARDALAAISKKQREEVTQHFREMCEARYQDHAEWGKWKAPVNSLLDVAAGSASLTSVVECYANGIVVQAATKLAETGMDGVLRISAGLLCVSGPGKLALAGVGVAAAVYFVPWDTVWAWFRAAFGALLSWLLRAWENLKAWVSKTAGGGGNGKMQKQGVELRVRPMLMAG